MYISTTNVEWICTFKRHTLSGNVHFNKNVEWLCTFKKHTLSGYVHLRDTR